MGRLTRPPAHHPIPCAWDVPIATAAMSPCGHPLRNRNRRAAISPDGVLPLRSRSWRGMWRGSANPVRPYIDWMKESKEYIRFVNPGDLRVAEETCGTAGCHSKEVRAVETSMMNPRCHVCGLPRFITMEHSLTKIRISAKVIRLTESPSAC